jgi:hypothetical protein
MAYMPTFSHDRLFAFIKEAGAKTYAGMGKREENPERPGFIELVYAQGDWFYRDSYTGFLRSRGMEVVRFQDKPVWSSQYGGGMVEDDRSLARSTFDFLKKVLSAEPGFRSFRGPEVMKLGEWEYRYSQEGSVEEFKGYEEISYQNKKLFYHHIMGGIIT